MKSMKNVQNVKAVFKVGEKRTMVFVYNERDFRFFVVVDWVDIA